MQKVKSIHLMEDASNAIPQTIYSRNLINPQNVYLAPTRQFALGSILLLPRQVTIEYPMKQQYFILVLTRRHAFKAIKVNLLVHVHQVTLQLCVQTVSLDIGNQGHMSVQSVPTLS